MAKNQNKSSTASLNAKLYGSVSTELYGGGPTKTSVKLSARYNPRSLTELAANKLEQMIKPKSLVELAAEKIEQSIKQPAKITKPSKMLPTLKTLAAQALVKDKINYWENKANNRLYKNTMRGGRRPNPIPAPRTKKKQPVAAPRTKIGEKRRAPNGFTKSYEIGLKIGAARKCETGDK